LAAACSLVQAFSVLVAREWPDAGRWPAWTFTAITPLGI